MLNERNRARLTVQAYKNDISGFAKWLNKDNPGNVDFASVTSSDVRAWLATLSRQGISPRSLRRKAQSLRALFMWMLKTNKIKVSPLRDIPLPKVPKHLPDIVRREEIEEVLKSSDSSFLERTPRAVLESLIIEILYTLGLRRAELASLKDEDISFYNAEIKVTGKRSKQRIVPVPEELLAKIKEWQAMRDKEEINNDEGYLFFLNGKKLKEAAIYYIVNKNFKHSSAKKKSPHALRHSFASDMLNGGANLDSVREFLGHASLATTQIYTHISLKEIKSAYASAHPRASEPKK